MPRSRMVKPEFWDDEKLSSVSRDARLLFVGLWTYSDDFGVVKGNHVWLKNKIFPYDDIETKNFEKWILELIKIETIIPFKKNKERYLFIKNFLEHQTINRPSKLRNPEPPKNITEYKEPGTLMEDSLSMYGVIHEEFCNLKNLKNDCFFVDTHGLFGVIQANIPKNNNGQKINDCHIEHSENKRNNNNHDTLMEDSQSAHNRLSDETEVKHKQNIYTGKNQSKKNNVPVDEILNLYHDILIGLPRVRSKKTIDKKIKARWKDSKEYQTIDFWEKFFIEISQSDYLMGKINPWAANLDWIIGPQNFEKILNGTYKNRNAPKPEPVKETLTYYDTDEAINALLNRK